MLFSLGPFVAAGVAALGARRDFRILWMAIAATILAWLVTMAMARSQGARNAGVAAFVSASVGAIGVAVLAGAYGAFGVIAVAVVVAAFASVGAALQISESATSPRG